MLIRKKFQCIQFSSSSFFIHPLGPMLIRNKFVEQMFFSMSSWVLQLSGTFFNANDHASTSLSHISLVLRWSRRYSNPNYHFKAALSNIFGLILIKKKRMPMHITAFQQLFRTSLGTYSSQGLSSMLCVFSL